MTRSNAIRTSRLAVLAASLTFGIIAAGNANAFADNAYPPAAPTTSEPSSYGMNPPADAVTPSSPVLDAPAPPSEATTPLPNTGSNSASIVQFAGAAVFAGAGLTYVAARRRKANTA